MALPAVIALMVVSAVLVTGVTTATLSAVGSATSSRASVQAQAAAEAGLAVAQSAILLASTPVALQCTFSSTAAPAYSVQVQYGTDIPGAPSCPAPIGALMSVQAGTALLVSTGEAATKGTEGVTAGDTRRLQAVLKATTTSAPVSAPPAAPASTSSAPAQPSSAAGTTNAVVFGGNSVDIRTQNHLYESTSAAEDALVYAGTGGIECANNTTVQGPVWSQGSATYANQCTASATRSAGSTNPPPAWTFPTLPSRASAGSDPLDAWRERGWTVRIFTGSRSCAEVISYLKQAMDQTTAPGAAWRTWPLLVVVRNCPTALDLDSDSTVVAGHTLTLVNDLAIMSDSGITNDGPLSIASSRSGQLRNLYWLVPSDTPQKSTSACAASLTPRNIKDVQDVHWMLYTPCDVTQTVGFGTTSAPVVGSVYAGGTVELKQAEVRYAAMTVPGLTGGGVTSAGASSGPTPGSAPSSGATGGPASNTGSDSDEPVTITEWTLTDVRDLARG